MGDVYLARDTDLDREVALKLISPRIASDKHALERLQREAKVLASLNHPNIVTIYTVERCETQQFLTMELVRGAQLSALIPEQGFSCDSSDSRAGVFLRKISRNCLAAYRCGQCRAR
jgi:serine/threonine-protein kinase